MLPLCSPRAMQGCDRLVGEVFEHIKRQAPNLEDNKGGGCLGCWSSAAAQAIADVEWSWSFPFYGKVGEQ